MTNTYLPDATDFTDLEVLPLPESRFPSMKGYTVVCPKCHGYGGWNLKLDAYPGKCQCGHHEGRHLHTNLGHVTQCYDCGCKSFVSSEPPERRHFRAMCFQCHGWGWVEPGPDAECLHTYVEIAPDQPWRCWHTYRCKNCGRTKSVDSSD